MRKTLWPWGLAVTVAVLSAAAFWWPQSVPTPAAVPVPAAPKLSAPPEAIDAQWAAIPTHPMPKVLSRTVVLLPGLPAPGKDSMAGVIKPWFADAWLTHQSVVELHGFTNAEWSVAVSSAAASLSGNSWDAVFVELQGLGLRDIRYADCPSKQEYVYRFDGRGYVE